VDVYQFLVWSDEWADQDEWLETVRQMRSSGKARFVGISINDHEPTDVLKALDTGLIDTVQVVYNICDQSPEGKLFPCCRRHEA
jgi:aryl-alcohol dehydrogenase-like predicted oxidoreductase